MKIRTNGDRWMDARKAKLRASGSSPAPRSAFVEYEGSVHLISPLMGCEFTLCGDACDAYSSEDAPERKFMPTQSHTVTCPKCAEVVMACKGVRVAPNEQAHPLGTDNAKRL
jgi:hypothetical protein